MNTSTYPPPFPPAASGTTQMEKVRSGQRCIIFAILLNFAMVFVGLFLPKTEAIAALAGLFTLGAVLCSIVLAILGVIRLGSGLGYGTLARILIIIGYFIPLVGLIILLVLNSQATKALRSAGYNVGFLGAAPKGR